MQHQFDLPGKDDRWPSEPKLPAKEAPDLCPLHTTQAIETSAGFLAQRESESVSITEESGRDRAGGLFLLAGI